MKEFANFQTHQKVYPDSSVGKESACNTGDPGLIPGSGRSAGEGIGCPFQYSGLVNSMDCLIHGGVTKSRARLSDFHFQTHQNVYFKYMQFYITTTSQQSCFQKSR